MRESGHSRGLTIRRQTLSTSRHPTTSRRLVLRSSIVPLAGLGSV
jgi:hypothetical protein